MITLMLILISWAEFPSHFTRIVLCASSAKVYKLIDVERDKAMEKMHQKQDMAKAKRLGATGAGKTSTAPRLLTSGSYASSIRTNAWDQEGKKVVAGMKEGNKMHLVRGCSERNKP